MYIKIHLANNATGSSVVAVCDEDLMGKTLRGERIEIKVTESFYKGEQKTEEEIIPILKQATNINLIGKHSVAAGIKAGVIEKRNVLTIQGVPHAQAFAI